MTSPLIKKVCDFSVGLTNITTIGELLDCRMNFSILKLEAGEHYDISSQLETAAVLLVGRALVSLNKTETTIKRTTLFHEPPPTLHLASSHRAKICATSACEFAIVSTDNDQQFESTLFDASTMLENEHRGKGLLNDTAYRIVRTVFDKRNRATSNLVIGEVVTFPGRWSSYPPHFHMQPEIYHYRFSEPQGFGYAELGDNVHKIHHGDTIKILDQKTHSQVSAPGYGMYYLWAIRHLPNDPYILPTFVPEHSWTKEDDANERVIKF